MHYIKQCLEPGRIMNYANEIIQKIHLAENGAIPFPKEAPMIELQLTDRCNLNCFHCHFRNQGDLDLERKWISKIMNEVRPKAISLAGGGEPTLYPDFANVLKEIKMAPSSPEIGLISNGVYMPPGDWHKYLSWIRISLYSVLSDSYAGRKPDFQKKVLDNISRYMQSDQLKMVGVSLLYYKGNVVDCVRLSLELYKRLLESGRSTEYFNLQFKRAFVVNDPRSFSREAHIKNLEITPDQEELNAAVTLKEKLSKQNPGFGAFLEKCTNYQQLERLLSTGTGFILEQTAEDRPHVENFPHCYAVLVSRLITPDGFIYTCPTIAEHRETALALAHITEPADVINKRLPSYYACQEPWCNSRYCRHTLHNEIVEDFITTGKFPVYDDAVLSDPFF